MGVMHTLSEDASMLDMCLRVLWVLAADEDCAAALIPSGCVRFVLQLLRSNIANLDLVKQTLGCFSKFTVSSEMCEHCGQQGLIQAIMDRY